MGQKFIKTTPSKKTSIINYQLSIINSRILLIPFIPVKIHHHPPLVHPQIPLPLIHLKNALIYSATEPSEITENKMKKIKKSLKNQKKVKFYVDKILKGGYINFHRRTTLRRCSLTKQGRKEIEQVRF